MAKKKETFPNLIKAWDKICRNTGPVCPGAFPCKCLERLMQAAKKDGEWRKKQKKS